MAIDTTANEAFLRATMGSMDLVYNVARRLVRQREDVEDLVQETYLAAFRAWKDRRRPERVEPWLATICLNLARSRFRRLAVRPVEVSLGSGVEATRTAPDDPEREAIGAVEREALYRAMWDLPEEQRVAITLVDLSGMTTHEAAEIMRTPRGTVLSRLHRGRRALAVLLADPIPEGTDR
jgi:RNA polymerase sigma-70 factor (ECF subfamily)